MGKLLKILLALVVLAGAATGVYAFSRGGRKADGGMKLIDAQLGSITEKAVAVGQIQPRQKFYRLGGEAVAGLSRDALADVRNRRVGFVFQSFNLLSQISAQENVEMPMLFGGAPVKERRARAAELLAKVNLGDRLDHKPTELSGGQMQRVAVARALARKPDILLADEPTGNLDSTSGSDIMGLFTEIWEQGGTLIVITHDMSLARRAGRVIEVHDGRILKDSAAEAA